MKYYKCLRKEKLQFPCYDKNVIYPEDYKAEGRYCSVKDDVSYDHSGTDFQEVPEIEYMLQKAKRDYPIATEVYSWVYGSYIVKVINDPYISSSGEKIFVEMEVTKIVNQKSTYSRIGIKLNEFVLYRTEDNQWAKKVEKMEDKKLIGYKLVKPEYEEAAAKIIYNGKKIFGLVELESEWENLKKAGVLNLWFEEVYEEKPKTPNIIINGYRAEFFDDYVKFGCVKIDREIFKDLHNSINASGNCKDYTGYDYPKQIEKVTIGKGEFTKEQIKEIVEYYKNK